MLILSNSLRESLDKDSAPVVALLEGADVGKTYVLGGANFDKHSCHTCSERMVWIHTSKRMDASWMGGGARAKALPAHLFDEAQR